ncbi:MAG TPA: YigZ family protein [Lachnoclostridium sp.]|nr:YigZ family protein [Lachnoclostridium sp.]
MDGRKILYKGGEGEIVEKKSRFIATLRPIASEEEAAQFLAEIRKKYWDARHHCSAFVLGERGDLTRCSDDGEPSGTAGRPMLDVLTGEGLTGCMAVVTRYFGGTLLGTGGLVRAYGGAVREGLKNCVLLTCIEGVRLVISSDYTDLGKIQYILVEEKATQENTEYTDRVTSTVLLPAADEERVRKKLTDATGGRCTIEEGGRPVLGEQSGKYMVLS